MKFFRKCMTIIGLFIFFMLFFLNTNYRAVFGGDSETIKVKNNSVIELNLWRYMITPGNMKILITIFPIKKSVGPTGCYLDRKAKTDDDIKGISILNNQSS
jgi:protease-4